MADEPSGSAADEQRELAALRRRAFGPDADIFGDPEALARLAALEERVLRSRAPTSAVDRPEADRSETVARRPETAGQPAVVVGAAPSPARPPRWHAGLVAGTAVVAVVLGAAAWTAPPAATVAPPSADAKAAETAADRRALGYEKSYDLYLDGLRSDVLELPGAGEVAERMIRDQLRPHGILYGRTVGAGPTVDNRFCMIIADLPAASVTCIPVEDASANPTSVLLPSWYSDSDSDLFTGLGDLVTYTLMPGGSVVAESASRGRGTHAPPADAAAPAPTATPPPGWQ